MKTNVLLVCFLLVSVIATKTFANYTYTITEYQGLGQLSATDSMLITENGGGGVVTLSDYSYLKIERTSNLERGIGGVWHISLTGHSVLYMIGGQVNQLDINNDATAILRGGRIDHIYSYQWVPTSGRDGEPIPYIKLYYSGDEPEWDPITNILTGTWGDGSSFTIQLHDVPSYSPAISNIDLILIPEPTTILLLGIGGLALRRKQR